MSIKTKVSTLAALSASAAMVLPGAASAAGGNSFAGSCVLPGTAAYSANGLTFSSAGACTGSVDGAPVATYQATNAVNETGTVLSLGIGPSLPVLLSGTGSLTLTRPGMSSAVTIGFTINQVGLGFTAQGIDGGSALGLGVPTDTTGTHLTVYLHTLGTERG